MGVTYHLLNESLYTTHAQSDRQIDAQTDSQQPPTGSLHSGQEPAQYVIAVVMLGKQSYTYRQMSTHKQLYVSILRHAGVNVKENSKMQVLWYH